MTGFERPQLTPLGATSLLARFGDRIDRDLSMRIARLVDHLDRQWLPGLIDLVPAYTTLVVVFDPEAICLDDVSGRITEAWLSVADGPETDDQDERVVEIPVVYGGEAGPDIEDVARATDLPADEVVRRHSEAEYMVGALGFSPGFAFLIGLPPELAVPRRATPRTRVPAGSVGIGGAQTGVYSLPTPGGWSLIGRTPRTMFDPEHESGFELRLGDRVRFRPIDAEEAADVPDPEIVDKADMPVRGVIEIIEPGVQTSVQDLGRPGQGRRGITPGGAVDRSALIAGNRVLGNPDDAAALEWTLLPPAIRFREACRIVLTGADPGWRLGDGPVTIGEVVEVAPGSVLRGQPRAETLGARGYVCVEGGIDVPEVRGSRALDLSASFGGGFGRPVRAGDVLDVIGNMDSPRLDQSAGGGIPTDPSSSPFRVVRGPQADRFGEDAWATFLSETFTVDVQSNRMGLRLNGTPIRQDDGADVISEGLVTGTIQVTGSGQPIVLMPGRATIGGYTRIATVIEADHDRLGQLRPGAKIRFTEVSVDEAVAALREAVPSVRGGLDGMKDDGEPAMSGDAPGKQRTSPAGGDAWTPDAVIRVLRELADHDVQAFSLRVEAAGLEIAIDRGGGPGGFAMERRESIAHETVVHAGDSERSDNPITDEIGTIAAPLLGTFWRRPSPDAPHFVEEGDRIEAGQTVGLIEVMKSFHEVTASQAGVVRRVLVEDGATVEYGQSLMELDPAH